MFQYKCMNNISDAIHTVLDDQYKKTDETEEADGIIVRSAKMHDMEFGDRLKAIVRAGSGVNNIPLERCAEEGIVVFNSPGANANSVKELVIGSMINAFFPIYFTTEKGLNAGVEGYGLFMGVTILLITHQMQVIQLICNKVAVMEYGRIVEEGSGSASNSIVIFHSIGSNKLEVKEGDKLSLGSHELNFVFAPMVHWPEVMFTYDSTDKVLFSADAFGKFGALDVDEDWACEARRYYFGIVGKYGVQVQAVLKKAAALDIQTICPLHGPILKEDLGYYLGLYNTWSSYGVESEGLFIAYTSVYGNTKKAAEMLRDKLLEKGCPKVAIADLAREDMAESVEDAFRYGKLVIATTTYNADIFPFMKHFILDLTERNYQNRTIGIIENGSWAPTAAKVIKGMFEKSKNITWTDTTVTIKSALKSENIAQIEALADELMK